jgi:hypothetical protein
MRLFFLLYARPDFNVPNGTNVPWKGFRNPRKDWTPQSILSNMKVTGSNPDPFALGFLPTTLK